jgi:FkbM family methyltransferase
LFKFREYENWKDIIREYARDKNPTKVVLKGGITISAPATNSILRGVKRIFSRNTYNPKNYEIGLNDTVVDIGANIGIFTLYAATKTKKRVYSFEPFPANFEYLQQNISLNEFNYVTPHLAAVSDKVETRNFLVNESTSHHLADENRKNNSEGYIEVQTVTLKHIMDQNGLDHIDFLKLDCEGGEGYVLLSTPLDYLKRIRKIAMEFHDTLSPLNHEEMNKILVDSGFKTSLVWDGVESSGYLFARRE